MAVDFSMFPKRDTMATITKTQKIETLFKQVQKRTKGEGVTVPPKRNVLDTLMYAAVFENTIYTTADTAFTKLQDYFIDWNEIRVCTVRELADVLQVLPYPDETAKRMKNALQGVFDKVYMFDLEEVKRRGRSLADNIQYLEQSHAGSPFMIDYTLQTTLEANVIPLDEAALRVLRRLGLTQISKDETKELGAGLERVVPKKNAQIFGLQLHHLAAQYYDDPDSTDLAALLKAVDPESLHRSAEPPQLKVSEHAIKKEKRPAFSAFTIPVALDDDDVGEVLGFDGGDERGTEPAATEKKGRGRPRKTGNAANVKAASMKPVVKPVAKPIEKPVPVITKKTEPVTKPEKTAKKEPAQKAVPKKAEPPKAKKTAPKSVEPKKKAAPVKPSKSSPPKKTPPVKPVKKPKAVSPSKALRKKKPK
jgi:endonuclease III